MKFYTIDAKYQSLINMIFDEILFNRCKEFSCHGNFDTHSMAEQLVGRYASNLKSQYV